MIGTVHVRAEHLGAQWQAEFAWRWKRRLLSLDYRTVCKQQTVCQQEGQIEFLPERGGRQLCSPEASTVICGEVEHARRRARKMELHSKRRVIVVELDRQHSLLLEVAALQSCRAQDLAVPSHVALAALSVFCGSQPCRLRWEAKGVVPLEVECQRGRSCAPRGLTVLPKEELLARVAQGTGVPRSALRERPWLLLLLGASLAQPDAGCVALVQRGTARLWLQRALACTFAASALAGSLWARSEERSLAVQQRQLRQSLERQLFERQSLERQLLEQQLPINQRVEAQSFSGSQGF